MQAPPPRDEYDRVLPEAIYYTHPIARPSIPRQLRESLARSRRHGIEWPLAWTIAIRHIAHEHELTERHAWVELLASDSYRELWRCAYLRQAYEPLDSVGPLRTILEEADVADARHRVTEGRAA
jgi:hypothetical protein